ncbi:unnamed protein product [Prunus armeniaca]
MQKVSFIFTIRSKPEVADRIDLPKELTNQVVLVFNSLSQLVDQEIEIYLTSWINVRELCGAKLHATLGMPGSHGHQAW